MFEGFYEVIPKEIICLLTEKELGYILAGKPKIDIEEMKKYMDYGDFKKDSPIVIWLFEILE